MNKIKVKSIVALVLLFSLCMCFVWGHARQASDYTTCLLYTSDAADE